MIVECEVLEGLAPFVEDEIVDRLGGRATVVGADATAVRVELARDLAAVLGLRTAVAAYLVATYPVPRPRGLLGHRHLTDLAARVRQVIALHAPGVFTSFRISAAGRESAIFGRLAAELAATTGLVHDPTAGDMLLRVRPAPGGGWEVLLRLSPRPLSARPWRVRDLPGALNATLAAAMVELSGPRAADRVVNLACGSGTLLVERLLRAPAAATVGVDLDQRALDAANANVDAAGLTGRVELARLDATSTGLDVGGFDVVLADPPYGHRMGTHAGNEALYPALLAEAGRLAAPGARFVVITHELRRFAAAIAGNGRPAWEVEREVQVFQKGHHPKIWLLRRAPQPDQ